ncbi:MAG: hypothetical protein V4479_04625 [Actinomycetota bacterium]
MTVEVAKRRRRGFTPGLVALILAVVLVILFVALFATGSSTDDALTVIVNLTFFGVPIAIILGAILAVIAIVLGAGRILGIVTLVLLIPQALFVAFAFYAIFLQNRGGV